MGWTKHLVLKGIHDLPFIASRVWVTTSVGFEFHKPLVREAILRRDPRILDILVDFVERDEEILAAQYFDDYLYQGDDEEYATLARAVLESDYARDGDKHRAGEALDWIAHDHRPRYKPRPKKVRVPEHGYVYILRAPAMDPALYKIGREMVFRSRVDSLGIKLPWDLELAVHIESDDYKGLEIELHQKFADKRVKGEWFRLEDEDITYIRSLESGEVQTNLCPK